MSDTITDAPKVKEHPILFSAPMVRAILSGVKTQTRRVVTVNNSYRQAAPNSFPFNLNRAWRDPGFPEIVKAEYLHVPFCHPDDGWAEQHGDDTCERWYCRWQPGDRLWVRETFFVDHTDAEALPPSQWKRLIDDNLYYRADRECCEQIPECCYAEVGRPRWRPGIHMPRWASRITLEVTDVRVQRLEGISEEDALAEGVTPQPIDVQPGHAYRECFRDLWDSIYGNREGCDWRSNPWVWAITFKRLEQA